MSQDAQSSAKAKRCNSCGQRFTNDAAFCPFCGEPLVDVQAADIPQDPLIGTTVDSRYEVIEMLGEGGMGAVYRVRHRHLQRLFALKVLRRDVARERDLSARFIQEARTAATINHPNVVQITDYGQLPDGIPYFVMELLCGLPLSRLLRSGGPLPAGRAVRIIRQISSGVGAAHRAGIVHRDLKPDNVFVLNEQDVWEQIKILDFGVAKVAGGARFTRTGMVFGSPHYMSPEQAAGHAVDHRADIYSVGIIMYELFTGRVPFEADTFMGVLTKHMFMAPESFARKLGSTHRELGALEDITLRCLEKKPEDRFPTLDALTAAIDEVVELGAGDEIDVRPSSLGLTQRSANAFRLADELEPPLPLEVSAARKRRQSSDRLAQWSSAAMILAACLSLAAVAILLWTRLASHSAPTSARAVLPAPIASVASASTPARDSCSPAQPQPVPVEVASVSPPATTGLAVSSAKSVRSRPSPPPPKKGRNIDGAGEIINPWGN